MIIITQKRVADTVNENLKSVITGTFFGYKLAIGLERDFLCGEQHG